MFDDIASLEDLGSLRGRSGLVRADLNVPLRTSGSGEVEIADDYRIDASLPTLRWLLAQGATVTVVSHLGRPKGHPVPSLAMTPVRLRLHELIPEVSVAENLRFSPGEESNDPAFGAALTRGHDFYVNDAFGASHRAHASIVYPPTVLPSAAGRLLRAELDALGTLIESPDRPFTVVVGGAKVADKIGMLSALSQKADRILVGGAMALTFLAATGRRTGDSPIEAGQLEPCRNLLETAPVIELPSDLIAVPADDAPFSAAPGRSFQGDVPDGWVVRDIGQETVGRFGRLIEDSASVLWNGPMGVFEDPRFARGTKDIAQAISRCDGFTVVGGGDTVSAVHAWQLADRFSHLSSGGGAMLQLVQDGDLPGLAALRLGNPTRFAHHA
jgi:phosphoglycerate kinase